MSGMKSKRKGKVGERELAKVLGSALGVPLRRGIQFKGTQDSPDIDGLGEYGLYCECKRTESTASKSLYSAIAQAVGDSGSLTPFVATRRNREDWLVVVKLSDLVDFCNRISNIANGRN